jgi:hypothetical protein
MYYSTLTPVVQDPEQELAMLLNTMVMVYGGKIYYCRPQLSTQIRPKGCIITATHIPLVVEALVLIVARILIGLSIVLVSYTLLLWSTDKILKAATKYVPDSVMGWAALAAKEHQISRQPNFLGRVRQRELRG